jgi:acyl-coenzyme A thioesterase PaaI-like protein
MAVASLQRLIPSVESGNTNFIREAWDKLQGFPGGKTLFSKMVGRAAPYTGTIGAKVTTLGFTPEGGGRSEVVLEDRPSVRNHLRCVHAVALVNLAELTGNVAVAYAMPDDARFIVAGLGIEYLKKARGTITGVCESPAITTSERREYEVVVSMRNEAGEEVARSTLQTLVGPKKA